MHNRANRNQLQASSKKNTQSITKRKSYQPIATNDMGKSITSFNKDTMPTFQLQEMLVRFQQ